MHDDSSIAGPSSSVNGTSGGAPAVGTATSVDFKSPYTTWQTRLHLDLDTTKYQDLKTRIEAEASQTGGRHEMNFLLFRGRRVADEETWRTAVKDISSAAGSQTMHVVFSFPQPLAATSPAAAPTPVIPLPTPTAASSPPPLMLNPSYLAISEAETFAAFIMRQCLSPIVDLDTLEWDQLTPKPRISFEAARDWVMELLRVNEIAIDADADLSVSLEKDRKGKGRADIVVMNGAAPPEADRDSLLRRLLESLSGIVDENQEIKIAVNVGGYPHNLVLPSLDGLESNQTRALLRLLAWQRISEALGRLRNETPMYTTVSLSSSSASTTTPGVNALPRRTGVTIRIRLTTDLLNVISNCLFAAFKVSIVFWMLTRGLQWTDTESLAIMAVGLCWWIWECGSILARERARLANQLRQAQNLEWARAERVARENGQVPPPPPPPVPHHGQLPGADAANPLARLFGRLHRHPGLQPARRPFLLSNDIASFDLAHERRVLRLFYDSGNLPATLNVDDRHIPDNDRSLPLAPPSPGIFYRYILLPVWLLLGSAFPILEQRRRAAIRQREEHMRLLVEKLTRDARMQQIMARQQANGDGAMPTQDESTARPENVLPRGLNEIAQRYYARVLARGEVIDWEEERAAQQAMGNGRNNEQDDEQMGLF